MTRPVRLRLSRWGNPYLLHQFESAARCVDHYRAMVEQGFVTAPYTRMPRPDAGPDASSFGAHAVRDVAPLYLAGKNLACWCRLCDAHRDGLPLGVDCPDCAPCHADVLLEIANERSPA